MNAYTCLKGLRLKYKGMLRWRGKQGRLEIAYDEVDGVWRGFMAVKVEDAYQLGISRIVLGRLKNIK
jgi:hypothetical protein